MRVVAVLFLLTASSAAMAQAWRDLTVTNAAAQPIQQLYVSPVSAEDWGSDRLGDGSLAPGRPFRVRLGKTRDCRFDLRAVYVDQRSEERRGIDVCVTRTVALDGASAAYPADLHPVELQNRSPETITEAYAVRAGTAQWGGNLLTAPTAEGAQATIGYRGDCAADLRIVFASRAAEERRGINVCEVRSLTIAPGWTTAELLAPPVPRTRDPMELTVVNRSGQAVTSLALFATGTTDRGANRVAGAALADKGRAKVPVPAGSECLQTIAVEPAGSSPRLERSGIDVCRIREITIAPGEIRAGDFGRFRNAGALPAVALRLHAAGEPPGPDRLGNAVLPAGAEIEVKLPTPGQCVYQVEVEFRDGRSARDSADLCRSEDVVLR